MDEITEAEYIKPDRLLLTFADGLSGSWAFAELGLDMSDMLLDTTHAFSGNVVVISKSGESVLLDAPTFRHLIDPAYAAKVDTEIDLLLIPSERLERIAANNQPPQEWYDSVEDRDG